MCGCRHCGTGSGKRGAGREEKYLSRDSEHSTGWIGEQTAAWESPDYLQRIEDREQEKYLTEWCRKHEKKDRKRRKEKHADRE